ncbi:MAG: hypothetical protein ACREFE_00070 [Limisphaerales bacterium]
MKKLFKIIPAGLLCCLSLITNAQDQPYLSITNDSPTSAQISWTN